MVKAMLIRSTMIHEHRRTRDRHFDWMIDDPANPASTSERALVTYRVPQPPVMWRAKSVWQAIALPPHRRAYLTLDMNRLSHGRGQVRAVDRGHVVIHRWTPSRRVLDVQLAGFRGCVQLDRLPGGASWRMKVLHATCSTW